MGYRSCVAYKIKFHDPHPHVAGTEKFKDLFYTFIAEAKAKDETALAMTEVEIDEVNREIKFKASDVKWYENYPDVQTHHALLDLAGVYVNENLVGDGVVKEFGGERIYYPCGYLFVRMGEQTDDIEEISGGDYDCDWVYVARELVANW